jgi:hypothetical protein
MCSPTGLARNSIEAQERMFRLAERDFGLSIRTLHLETRIPVNTLQGWRNGTTMPAWALGALGKAGIPDYLLSLVLHPFERHVGTDEDGDGALEELVREAAGFTNDYLQATSANSPGGPVVIPMERAKLAERALVIEQQARRVRA